MIFRLMELEECHDLIELQLLTGEDMVVWEGGGIVGRWGVTNDQDLCHC